MAKSNVNDQVDDNNDDGEGLDNDLFPNADDLASAEAIWGEGSEADEKSRPVGSMQAEITEATMGRSSSDKLQIHYKLLVLTGPGKDETLNKYDGLDTPERARITQNQLRRLGVDTKKINIKMLPSVLMDLQGKKIVINCKQNGDFYNIYFTKLVNDKPTSGPREGGGKPAPTNRPPGGKPVAAGNKGGGFKR